MVKTYSATFIKNSGQERRMNFVRFQDLPEKFLEENVKNRSAPKALKNGSELVWDLDSNGFRTFNWNTISGPIENGQTDLT